MSKRNIILIAIVLVALALLGFVFAFFYKPTGNNTSPSSDTNFFSDFFPFGKSTSSNQNPSNPTDISGKGTGSTSQETRERLFKISGIPIAGYGVFTKERYKDITPSPESMLSETQPIPAEQQTPPAVAETEFVPILKYVDRANGNIYQTFLDKIEEKKVSSTVIPIVYEAFLGNGGDTVIDRYLKENDRTIETFAGNLPKEVLGGDISNENSLTGSFLPENVLDLSLSPNKTSIFYIFKNEDTVSGITAEASGEKRVQIFESPFTEWLSAWPNDRMITLTTKPSYASTGYMYSLDPVTKKTKKILSGIDGLTTLTSPNGRLVLYNDKNLNLKIYNLEAKDSFSFAVRTMPEKCVWNSASTAIYCSVPRYVDGSEYPDSWYQGEKSFSDEIWKVNVETGSSQMLADPMTFTKGEDIDGIKLSLDEGENYLFFVNKKDSYLWGLKLN